LPPADGTPTGSPDDLSGRRFLVTGANSGIGEAATRDVARRGAHVVLACRDTGRGRAAAGRIRAAHPGASVEVGELDLASLASVRAFAEAQLADGNPLDVLVNNAGVMAVPRRITEDGFELQLATNHLGHVALTARLLPALLAAPAPRVVTVASLAHKFGAINLADLQYEHDYDKRKAYGRSKLANLLFAFELQRRASAAGLPLLSVAAHPGLAASNLSLAGPAMSGSALGRAVGAVAGRVYNLLSQSADKGARPTIAAATWPDVKPGGYYGPSGPGEIFGSATEVTASPAAHDETAARLLWEASEQLTGVDFGPLDAAAR
jgi:NAD(P)-dependent dehydrogenase (short-subunit alcohol dehydrogenase family)